MNHRYSDILYAIAAGKPVERNNGESWVPSTPEAFFADLHYALSPHLYRVAVATITINGITCPAPCREALDAGQEYFCPNVTNDDRYNTLNWFGDSYDNKFLSQGLVYLRAEDAACVARAMIAMST